MASIVLMYAVHHHARALTPKSGHRQCRRKAVAIRLELLRRKVTRNHG